MKGTVHISRKEIQNRTVELGREISADYKGKELLIVVLLRGSFIFAADLVRAIDCDIIVDFMKVSSYMGKQSSGEVRILKELDENVHGRHVLIVEDIVDTGLTLNKILELLKSRNPRSMEICTLLSKPSQRVLDVYSKYIGFEIENKFVVGYGLDYDQRYRHLPDIMEMAD